MKIQLRILTPTHIGSGEAISPLEYLVNDNKFIRLDMDGLFRDPDFKPRTEKFIQLSKSQRYIGKLLPNDLLLRHSLYSLDISSGAKGANPIEVKSFVKSAGRVFIPGSSLKGSILSGIMEKVLKEKGERRLRNFPELLDQVLSKMSTRCHGRFSRWLNVGDSELKKSEETLELSLAKLVGARSGRQMSVFYETLKENIEFELEIKTALNNDRWGKKSEGEILNIANEFYRKVYEKEKGFSQNLPEVSPDSFLFRIGQGSTAWSTSFLILAEELGIRNYTIQRPRFHRVSGPPRTRKLVTGTKSMGWVEVTYA